MRLLIAVVPIFFLMTGCFATKVVNSAEQEGELIKHRRSHFVGGLGTSVIKVDCPKGVYSIAEGQSFGDRMLTGLTLGIWNASTAKVTCAK